MKRKYLLLIIILNLFIAVGYFFENKGVGFTQLSSDLYNSIPVCYKIDDPSLFKNDLYLFDIENVKYYTPFFIQTIRFFAFLTGGDYLLGMNIFATILHLVYGISWFLLFYKVLGKFSIALFLSVLIRGIVWLPGLEIWGISDLWTMMPRTVYIAFMPIPFLLLLYKTRTTFYSASFLIGFLFNLHPVTGMGGSFMFVLFVLLASYFYTIKIGTKNFIIAAILLILGMLPFLSTYFLMTDTVANYDLLEYKEAFSARIPDFFADPILFLGLWVKFKTLFFLLPLLVYLGYGLFIDKEHKKPALILVMISFVTILMFSLSVYFENGINHLLGLNLRMSFQMIRAQKLAILPGYFALGFLVSIAIKRIKINSVFFNFGIAIFLLCLLFSKETFFKKVPFFRDDIATSIFPDYHLFFLNPSEKDTDADKMLSYIDKNTPSDAVFFGNCIIRSAAKRSVVLDGKGASMLIEGNPVELIQWNKEKKYLESLTEIQKIIFLRDKKNVTHIFSTKALDGNLRLIHSQGKFRLYKVL